MFSSAEQLVSRIEDGITQLDVFVLIQKMNLVVLQEIREVQQACLQREGLEVQKESVDSLASLAMNLYNYNQKDTQPEFTAEMIRKSQVSAAGILHNSHPQSIYQCPGNLPSPATTSHMH